MAVSNLDFAGTVDAWANESTDRLERIWKTATQKLASIANRVADGGSGVPIDTGFAHASFHASTDSMLAIDPNATNKHGIAISFDLGEISVVIASAEIGQTIYLGWTAAYILPLEFGHSKQAPQGFARIAAAQWPVIVSEATSEAKARAA